MSRSLWTEDWYCRSFLRAGGCITAAEWIALTDEEQDALSDAGEFIRAETALLLSHAIRSPGSVLSAMMDDDARERAHLAALLDRAERIEAAA